MCEVKRGYCLKLICWKVKWRTGFEDKRENLSYWGVGGTIFLIEWK